MVLNFTPLQGLEMKTTITENQIDGLVHMASNYLNSQGIELGENSLSDLNDELSSFFQEACMLKVTQEEDKKDTIIQVAFDITDGTFCQQVKIINGDYDEERILKGLSSGELTTNTGYEDGLSSIDINATDEKVALILSQEGSGNYSDYR